MLFRQVNFTCPRQQGHFTAKAPRPCALVRSVQPDKVPVFSLDPQLPIGKLEYIQDALDTCSVAATKEQRRQCFETFGLDCEKVDRYYKTVSRLEELVHEDEEVGYQVVTGGGAGLLWIVALCLFKTA